MKTKNSGIISDSAMEDKGIEELFYPSFFLGTLLPIQPFDILTFKYSPKEIAFAEREIGLSSLKSGQFAMFHQYAGYSCSSESLLGVFMPLSSANDLDLFKALDTFTKEFQPKDPTRASLQWPHWQPILKAIGPLESPKEDFKEAFIRFPADRLYSWLKAHFRYVTEVQGLSNEELKKDFESIQPLKFPNLNDPNSQEWSDTATKGDQSRFLDVERRSRMSRRISKLEPLPWTNLDEFAVWLSRGEKHRVKPEDVKAALIYENSD